MATKGFLGSDPTVYFSDFDFDFSPHPMTGDINILKNETAVKNSVRNLIQTKFGEILFDSSIGCGLNHVLFDFMDSISQTTIQRKIEQTLTNYEPRVKLHSVDISEDTMSQGYFVNVYFSIINTTIIENVSVFLKRTR